jgi:hypothetical protein
VSGYPFFGSDIGGYREGTPTTEVLIRWAQYAALGTIMQLGGGGPSHNPWDTALYPAPALDVYRTYARLHLDLNPLLWTLALAAGADGTPVTRPCGFVYPDAGVRRRDVPARRRAAGRAGDRGRRHHARRGAAARALDRLVDRRRGHRRRRHRDHRGRAARSRLPLWRAADRFVPMFARAADTLEPATAPGVTSYADPAYGASCAC